MPTLPSVTVPRSHITLRNRMRDISIPSRLYSNIQKSLMREGGFPLLLDITYRVGEPVQHFFFPNRR